MTIAVVTTSINAQPLALDAWSRQPDVSYVFVAGDENSPDELVDFVESLPGGNYVSMRQQEGYSSSWHVPWRCVQRRNFALIAALRAPGVTHVLIVDDDNAPVGDDWTTRALVHFTDPPRTVAPMRGRWFDPGSLLRERSGWSVHARGLPYDIDRAAAAIVTPDVTDCVNVVVFQAGVTGDPDVDAMERMVVAPEVTSVASPITLAPGFVAPINSQATLWRRDYAPLAAVPPCLGRMDDIWGGLVAQRIFSHKQASVVHGAPAVRQVRNQHNLVSDLEQELLGYRYTSLVENTLRDTPLPEASPMGCYRHLVDVLREMTWFPGCAAHFMRVWANDVDRYVDLDVREVSR